MNRKAECKYHPLELELQLQFAIPKLLIGDRMAKFRQFGKDNKAAAALSGQAAHDAANKTLDFLQSDAIGLSNAEAWAVLYLGLNQIGGENILK